jgi:hypothetical protein
MPQVPTYGPPRVSSAPLPSARRTNLPSPDSFGAGFGKQIAAFGMSEFERIVQEQRDMADQVALLNAENQLLEFERTIMRDPESGALTKRGRDSLGLPEEVGKAYQQRIAAITESLSNDRQRLAFGRVSGDRMHSTQMELQRHVFSEIQQLEQTERIAYLDNLINRATQIADNPTPTMPNEIAAELQRGREAIDRAGMGPEAAEAMKREFDTKVHMGVLSELADGHPTKAQAYYEAAEDEIHVDQRDRARSIIEEGTRQTNAQRTTDAIMLTATSEQEALAMARDQLEGQLEDDVVQRLKVRWSEVDQQEQRASEEQLKGFYDIIDAERSTDNIPRAEWSDLTGAQRNSLQIYADKKATGEGIVMTRAAWRFHFSLMQEAVDNPTKFKNRNLFADARHRLDDPRWNQVLGIWMSLRENKPGQAAEMAEQFQTKSQIVNAMFRSADIEANTPESDEMLRQLEERVQARMFNQGVDKLTNAEIQEEADLLWREMVVVKGSGLMGFIGALLPGGITPGQLPVRDQVIKLSEVTFEMIPENEREQMRQLLLATPPYRVPSNPDILQAWQLSKARELRKGGGG